MKIAFWQNYPHILPALAVQTNSIRNDVARQSASCTNTVPGTTHCRVLAQNERIDDVARQSASRTNTASGTTRCRVLAPNASIDDRGLSSYFTLLSFFAQAVRRASGGVPTNIDRAISEWGSPNCRCTIESTLARPLDDRLVSPGQRSRCVPFQR